MSFLLTRLFVIFSLISCLSAEDIFISVYQDVNETNLTNSLASNSNKESNKTNVKRDTARLKNQKSIFLSFEEIPKRVYLHEIFTIKVKAIIATTEFEELKTVIKDTSNLDVLNKQSNWKWYSDNIFYNTYYIKTKEINASLPAIELIALENGKKIDSATLNPEPLNIIKLNGTKYFSGVIAESLKVLKHKTTQFDDQNNIIVIEMEAFLSNLKDFKLKWVIKDGIDSSKTILPKTQIYYYAIIPNYIKKFDFTYFNKKTNKFKKISLPIVVDNEEISTQIDLNPAHSSLKVYKNILYALVAVILLLLLIKRRKIIYIIMLLLLIALFIDDKNIFKSIKIEQGTNLQILPTPKSTIFYKTDRTLYATKLDERGNYIKVMLPNGKIGWIKETNGKD